MSKALEALEILKRSPQPQASLRKSETLSIIEGPRAKCTFFDRFAD